MPSVRASRDDLYREASALYGAGLDRLARAYEADPEQCRDLLQEIHLALWRSFERFEARCSIRTWAYRVAHNTALAYVVRQCRTKLQNLVTLEDLDANPDQTDYERVANERMALEQLLRLIHRLRPPDREVMLLYLEELDAPSTAEITGMSPGNVRTSIYRIKNILSRRFHGRLLGPNGAGKSTTLKILTGILQIRDGRVSIETFQLPEQAIEVKKHIGYVPESADLYESLSALEFLELCGRLHEIEEPILQNRIIESQCCWKASVCRARDGTASAAIPRECVRRF